MPIVLASCSKKADQQQTPISIPTQLKVETAALNVQSQGAKGDGVTDNTAFFQKALNSGKALYIPKGTYLISKPLVKTSGTLSITADHAIIKLAPSFPAGGSDATGAFILSNLTSASVSGLTIDGNRQNLQNAGTNWTNYIMGFLFYTSSNIQLSHCNILNAPSISYEFRKCSQLTIDHCTSTNGMYHGVDFQYCNNATVQYSRIIGIGNQGTDGRIGGIGMLGTGGGNLSFKNNYIANMSDTGTKTEGSNNVTWNADTVSNSGKDGIKFQNLAGADQVYGGNPQVYTVNYGTITNNIVNKIFNGRSDGSSEIQVWNASNVVVSGNTITGGIKTGQEDGIDVWATVGTTANVTISNNKISNTNRFIYLGTVSNVSVTNNICSNNALPLTLYNGFQAETSTNLTIQNNQFTRYSNTSANGTSVNFFDCGNFAFVGNTVRNGYTGLTARLTASHSIKISNNTFDNFGSYFASLGVGSAQTIDSLSLANNSVSHFGMTNGLGWILKIDPTNLTCSYLDFSNSKIIGNGNNGEVAITVPTGGVIKQTNFTNLACSGNALYPTLQSVAGCSGFIGWQGN